MPNRVFVHIYQHSIWGFCPFPRRIPASIYQHKEVHCNKATEKKKLFYWPDFFLMEKKGEKKEKGKK